MAEGPVLYRSGRALDSLGGGTLYPVSCATLYGTQEGVRIRQMAHSRDPQRLRTRRHRPTNTRNSTNLNSHLISTPTCTSSW